MDVRSIREERNTLQNEITRLIREFETYTETTVSKVDVFQSQGGNDGGQCIEETMARVEVTL